MRKNKKNKKLSFHPVMGYVFLIIFVILLSFLLALFNTKSTYNLLTNNGTDYIISTESVTSLFNLSGIKYIFTNTVSNFANFSVLSNLLIILIGIGVMEKSGFLKTSIMMMTKKAKKKNVTFVIVLLAIISSIIGDLSYLIFIPISALIFLYGKRNPLIGIVASFAALTCGSGLSLLFTSIDSSLQATTLLNASVFGSNYSYGNASLLFINLFAIVLIAYLITRITEEHIAKKLPKYDFPSSDVEEEIVSKKELKGLVLALIFASVYLLIIIYNIIPGLPGSGNFLDYSQNLYIDKLFSYDSFFTKGYVFIVTLLFIILGLFYGIGSKSIKNSSDFSETLGYSLDGIGKTIVLIFMSSTFISIFKQTNIGATLVVALTNLLSSSNFTGFPLVILLFLISIVSSIFVPTSITKWPIIASSAVPMFINAGLSPEFCQVVYRFGESVSIGLTPMLAYFILYLAYLEKYSEGYKKNGILNAIKLQFPYSLAALAIYLVLIIIWYVTNFPLGIGGVVSF